MKYLSNILIFILAVPALVLGQVSIEKDIVAAGGDHVGLASLQVSWTVGDVSIDHKTAGSLILTEGFQQSVASPVTGIAEVVFPGEISFFPNPVDGWLHFTMRGWETKEVLGELWDMTGKKVADIQPFTIVPGSEFSGNIDFGNLSPGEYLLRFTIPSDNAVRSYSIVKVR